MYSILYILKLPKLHIFERIFWMIVLIIAFGGAVAVFYSNWRRFLANPTVVTLQKDFRNWENPFPAVTGCYLKKVDDEKADKYIFDKWGINSTHSSYNYYMEFIATVMNVSYKNLGEFEKFIDDKQLQYVNIIELAAQIHPNVTGTLVTFDPKTKVVWSLVLSEMGVCFSVNSKFASLMALKKTSKTRNPTKILRCHYLNGLCYGRFDLEQQRPVKYYIHSYSDVIHATSGPHLLVEESQEVEINYRMQETSASLSLRYLAPSQRRCRFDDEPLDDNLPVFSTGICYMTCRYKLAMKLCGCKPFFYHYFGGEMCDFKGLACLSRHASNITKPPAQIGCHCPEQCNLITYFPQTPKYTKWEYGYFDKRITFRWGLLPPTTKFRRDVLFGFGDLIVSFGGTLALFLGVSFLSVIELIFLVTENAYKYYKRTRRNAIRIQVHQYK